MTRKRWIYQDGIAHEVSEDYSPDPRSNIQIVPDIQPYQSMVTGEIIHSRSRHKSHLKQHGMIEVGNDSSLYKTPQPHKAPPGLKDTVIRAFNDAEEQQRRKKWH